jgi:hypothetical protein
MANNKFSLMQIPNGAFDQNRKSLLVAQPPFTFHQFHHSFQKRQPPRVQKKSSPSPPSYGWKTR